MKRTAFLLLALIALSAIYCSKSATGPDLGRWSLSILSGDKQITTAGADSLLAPVVGQLVALPNGQTAFVVGARPLNAQTTVGTPLPNQVVCAVGVGAHPLMAWNPCTNTDSQGQAKFWFQNGTLAGVDSAEVRGVQNDSPVVAAIVTATVEPGPVDSMYEIDIGLARSAQPRTMPDAAQVAADAYGNGIASCPVFAAAASATVRNAGTDWPACRSMSWDTAYAGGTFEARDSTGTTVGWGWYEISAGTLYLYGRGLSVPCNGVVWCGG